MKPIHVTVLLFVYSAALVATWIRTLKVVGVRDVDSIPCLTHDMTQMKVRLDANKAPQRVQSFGQACKKALSGMPAGLR